MQIYEMAQYEFRGIVWVLVSLLLVLAVLLVCVVQAPAFEASGDGLRIRGTLFGRTIPAAVLRLSEARVVDLRTTPALQPAWRLFGVGLPGYRAGWFRLGNKERALVFLGRSHRALYIPTTAGYALLIAPNDPDGCLGTLRSGAA